MRTEKNLIIVEQVCEFAIGFAVAAAMNTAANPKGPVAKTLVAVGATAVAFVVGRKFGKEFAEVCDNTLNTNLKNKIV
jgi:hypothetical protein